MLLGDVLSRLADGSFAAEILLTLDDLPLLVDVESLARRFGESAPSYAANAVRQFAASASDDDWLTLMSAVGRSPDPDGLAPGTACLRHMLRWSVRRDSHHTEGE